MILGHSIAVHVSRREARQSQRGNAGLILVRHDDVDDVENLLDICEPLVLW